jgi:peptide/nickel transport system permease protein
MKATVVQTIFASRFFRSRPAIVGIAILVAIAIFVLAGPLFVHANPNVSSGPPNQPPSFAHPFGTDIQGRDLLSQMVFGAYPTLSVGVIAAVVATLIGFVLGVLGGYYEKLRAPISGATDIVLSFPALILLMLIGSMFLYSNTLMAEGMIVILWAFCTRAVLPQVAAIKKAVHVEAAKISGMGNWEIIVRIIAPEVGAIAIAYFVLIVSVAIVLSASVQFVGVGNATQVSWGTILYFAQKYAFFFGDWWWIAAPGLMLGLTATAFALIGFSIEEVMNPRLRSS